MARRSYKSSGSARASRDRLTALLLVFVLAAGAFLAAGYAVTAELTLAILLVVLGALWLSGVALLHGATGRRIDGVEPQTALITFGLTLMLFPGPLAFIFLLAGVASVFFWGRRGFRL